MNKKLAIALAVTSAFALGSLTARADDDDKLDPGKLPPASSQTNVTYAADIKPILDKSCVKCHSGDKPKGKLDLTTLEGVLKGGKDGKEIVPGKIDKSPLVFDVAHIGEDSDFMPPPESKSKVKPLTKEQVGLIRAWVEQGAK
jgi:hypothetical protein